MLIYILISILILLFLFIIRKKNDKKFLRDIKKIIRHNLNIEKIAKDELYFDEMLKRDKEMGKLI